MDTTMIRLDRIDEEDSWTKVTEQTYRAVNRVQPKDIGSVTGLQHWRLYGFRNNFLTIVVAGELNSFAYGMGRS
jgi:hypothetical protein